MKTTARTDLLLRCGIALLAFALLLGLHFYAVRGKQRWEASSSAGKEYEKVRVLEILDQQIQNDPDRENQPVGRQTLLVEILTGRYAGDQIQIENYLSGGTSYSVYAEKGSELIARIDTTDVGEYRASVYSYSRSLWIWVFVGLFVLTLIAVGGKQGASAVVGLAFTMLGVLFVLVPLLTQRGWSPIPATVLIVTLTMTVSYVLIGGIGIKTVTAAVGSFGGIAVAGLLAWSAGALMHLNGLNMPEAPEMFQRGVTDNGLRIAPLFVCGVMLAAEGAVMDVSMSVASAMHEVHAANPKIRGKALFRAGMRVGRDAMGTMANTLILAFAGASLNAMILIYAYDVAYYRLINENTIVMEIVQSLAGSMGIVLTVPLVSLVGSMLHSRKQEIGKE